MKAIFDHLVVEVADIKLPIDDRAFQYGDGLFETMVVEGRKFRFPGLHFERLKKGSDILKLNHSLLDIDQFKKDTEVLLYENPAINTGRVRMQVWRKMGGFYQPESKESHTLLTIKPLSLRKLGIQSLGVSQKVSLSYSDFSELKTLNSIPFVVASQEARESEFDDLILLGPNQILAECSSSNIFWTIGNTIYTPSLKSGCVSGVMRKYCLDIFKENNIHYEEVLSNPEVLLKADSVFKTNVTGIVKVGSFENHIIANNFEFPKELEKFVL